MCGVDDKVLFEPLVCTSVQVYPFKEARGKVKAFARVLLNDQMQLTGLCVVDGGNGFFVSYPLSSSSRGNEFHSVFFPISKELREHIEQCVLEKFQEVARL